MWCTKDNLTPFSPQNLWIVKPAKLSRGRGIRVFDALPALLECAAGLTSSLSSHRDRNQFSAAFSAALLWSRR